METRLVSHPQPGCAASLWRDCTAQTHKEATTRTQSTPPTEDCSCFSCNLAGRVAAVCRLTGIHTGPQWCILVQFAVLSKPVSLFKVYPSKCAVFPCFCHGYTIHSSPWFPMFLMCFTIRLCAFPMLSYALPCFTVHSLELYSHWFNSGIVSSFDRLKWVSRLLWKKNKPAT